MSIPHKEAPLETFKPKEWTYEDYLALPEGGPYRYEIIDGELYIIPSGSHSPGHQKVAGSVFAMFWNHFRHTRGGEVFFGPCDVVLSRSPFQIVLPDLVVVSNERSTIVMEQNIQGVPDLVVEILSEGTDWRKKHSLYERFGVPEYWLVDPEAKTVQVFRLSDGRYGTCLELRKEDILESPRFPGLSIPLSGVFSS